MSEITPADLPKINELDEFTTGIPELQTDTPVLAGTNGPANFQAQALANRTTYLKRVLDLVRQELIGLDQSIVAVQQSTDASMKKSANGADIVNQSAFRANLGLGDAAILQGTDVIRNRGSLGTRDLNTITGSLDGDWSQNSNAQATVARNYPVSAAGLLQVRTSRANTNESCIQRYIPYNSITPHRRFTTDGINWTAWYPEWNGGNLTLPLSLANGGSGKVSGAFANGPNVQSGVTLSNFLDSISNYGNNSAGSANISDDGGTWHTYLSVKHRSGVGDGASYGFILEDRSMTSADYPLVVRKRTTSGWIPPVILWHSGNLASPMTLDTAQSVTAIKTFASGFVDQVTGIGRSTSVAPVVLTAPSQLSSMVIGQRLFVNATGSLPGLIPEGNTAGYYSMTCLHKPDNSVSTGMILASRQGSVEELHLGWINTNGSVTWSPVLLGRGTQTISGTKIFASTPLFRANIAGFNTETTAISEGTVGRWVQFVNDGTSLLKFYIRAGANGLPVTANQRLIQIPTDASGTLATREFVNSVYIGRTYDLPNSQTQPIWFRIAEMPFTTQQPSRVVFHLSNGGIGIPGGNYDTIMLSARGTTTSTVLTQALVNSLVRHIRHVNEGNSPAKIGVIKSSTGLTFYIRMETFNWGNRAQVLSDTGATLFFDNLTTVSEPAGIIYAAVKPSLVLGQNATVDANGFYKTASPVINIYSDGSFTTTDEAEGVNVERLSEGVYKISGCQGMHSDAAWGGSDGGVSNPKCRNGLALTWNDFDVDEDGSVIVRTYHRPHPDAISFARNEIDGYENGDPIDVPKGLYIQVRVNMPDRDEQTEIQSVSHSNVYCNTISSAK